MKRVDMLSDQLELYAKQVALEVDELENRNLMPAEEAVDIVKAASIMMMADALWSKENASVIREGLMDISRSLIDLADIMNDIRMEIHWREHPDIKLYKREEDCDECKVEVTDDTEHSD